MVLLAHVLLAPHSEDFLNEVRQQVVVVGVAPCFSDSQFHSKELLLLGQLVAV